MFCPNCGAENDDNAFRCLKCAEILQDLSGPDPGPSGSGDKTATIAIVAAAIGALVFFVVPIIVIVCLSTLGESIENTMEKVANDLESNSEPLEEDAASKEFIYK